jgi:hypothetical protein
MSSSGFNARVRPQRPKWPWAVIVFVISEGIQFGGVASHLLARGLFALAACLLLWDIAPRLKDRWVGWKRKAAIVTAAMLLVMVTWGACIYLAPHRNPEPNVVRRILDGVEDLFKKYAGSKHTADTEQGRMEGGVDAVKNGDKSRFAKGALPILELSPYALLKRVRYKSPAGDGDVGGTEYGLAAILRINNTTPRPIQIEQLEIVGDVAADGDDFTQAFSKDGDSFEGFDTVFGKLKPFRSLSLLSYPLDDSYIRDQEERFLRFVIVDPEKHKARMYVGDPKDYFGSRASKTTPKLLTRVPFVWDMIHFTGSVDAPFPPGTKEFRGPQLKQEFLSGSLAFRVVINGAATTIKTSEMRQIRWTTDSGFLKERPMEMFWGTGAWDRTMPATKDPHVR